MSDSPSNRTVTDTMASSLRQAGTLAGNLTTAALEKTHDEVRAHRQEVLLLAATLVFAALVGTVAFALVFG